MLKEDCASREGGLWKQAIKLKSGSMPSKSSSDGKTGEIKICETGLSTNDARSG